MTVLRQRMIEDMQLRGLAARTQEAYVAAVEQLTRHCRKPPDEISEEELRQYLLYLANEKVVSASTMTVALCGIKFLYQHTLIQTMGRLALFSGGRLWSYRPSVALGVSASEPRPINPLFD